MKTKQKIQSKKISVKEMRIELHKFGNVLYKLRGKNKVAEQYFTKVRYMLMWLRLIPVRKSFIKNWHMPDMGTINKIEKGEFKW
jgi:hypothetical protein